MKKMTAIALALICVLTLAACGNTTEKDKAFVCGTVTDNVYESEFSGFKMTVSDGWVFSGEEEIMEMMDFTADSLSEILSDREAKNLELSKQKTIYDAMAVNQNTGSNVIVMYENMSASIGGSLYTPDSYADVLEDQLTKTGAEAGMDYSLKSKESIDFCGNEYLSVTWETETQGITLEQSYLLRKVGDYMLVICITCVPQTGATLDSIMAMFESLEA